MRSRLVRWQLVAFGVIAVLGIVIVGANYVRLDKMFGFGTYTVTAHFPTSGGVFQNAEVTYRGVPVGRVGSLSLTPDGIAVALDLDSGGPDIPTNAVAVVANRSAIGEQYVDLRPTADEGPYLADGSELTSTANETPVPVEQLLVSTDRLVRSVPLDDLRTFVTELGTAFGGRGDELQALVDSLASLSQAGVDYLPDTTQLIRDSAPVLTTQSEQSSAIRQFSNDLELITAQLKSSDPDVRTLIGTGTDFSGELSRLVDRNRDNLTADLQNLGAVAEKLGPQAIALQPLLAFLPAIAGAADTIAPGDGTVRQGAVLETNNPPPCTIGYEGTHRIIEEQRALDPSFDPTTSDFPLNTEADCLVPEGSVTGVRSAQRIALADPLVPQPWDLKPKVDPDRLDLNPAATQIAPLLGVTPR